MKKQAMWLSEGKIVFVLQGTKTLSCQRLGSFERESGCMDETEGQRGHRAGWEAAC